jgi:hypothetical protein
MDVYTKQLFNSCYSSRPRCRRWPPPRVPSMVESGEGRAIGGVWRCRGAAQVDGVNDGVPSPFEPTVSPETRCDHGSHEVRAICLSVAVIPSSGEIHRKWGCELRVREIPRRSRIGLPVNPLSRRPDSPETRCVRVSRNPAVASRRLTGNPVCPRRRPSAVDGPVTPRPPAPFHRKHGVRPRVGLPSALPVRPSPRVGVGDTRSPETRCVSPRRPRSAASLPTGDYPAGGARPSVR